MKTQTTKTAAEDGFTLIELMVSIIIFLMAIGMSYQVMKVGLNQKNTVSTRIDAVKSSRIALSYIRRDVINAGLGYHNIGGLVPDNYTNSIISAAGDADSEQDFLTGVLVGNNVSTNVLNSGVMMDSIGMIVRDLTFNDGQDVNFVSTSANGSSVIIKTKTGDAAKCKKFDIYLFVTGTTQAVGMVTAVDTSADTITLAVGDPLGINLAADGTGNNKSVLIGTGIKGSFKKIILTTYQIDSLGNLVRKTYGNQADKDASSQIDAKPLISNVKDFQIKYLLDSGVFTDDPTSGNNGRINQQKMNNVVEVEVTITEMQQDNPGMQASAPIQVKEIISTRNLRYKIN